MAINFPGSLDTLTNPTGTDLLENATAALDHDVQHSNANDAIEALEAKVGANSSAVTTSHDYKLSAVTGSAKALTSGTSTQSVTNLTLVTPTLTLTSDATGDMYYRNSGGSLTRLPIGTAGQILDVSAGGIPEWIANPAVSDASTTVKGVVEEATQGEVDAGTAAGATSARLFVNPSTFGTGIANYLTANPSILENSQTITASGSIIANDAVYITAANTAASIYPSAQGTGASISTAPTTNAHGRSLPLSTNGLYLNISGGKRDVSGIIYAQVRTLNAGETDFANGTEYAVYNTGNGVRQYDVCSIGTDKFLFIFQADTGGAAAGIKAVVCTVSGTVVTTGSVATIETTGSLTRAVSCAKLDTDKGIIFYTDDSGADIYMKVLTVSGTTITQNAATLVKTLSLVSDSFSSIQLGTDSVLFSYSVATSHLYARTITVSGTTPTANTERDLIATNDTYYHKLTYMSATKAFLVLNELSTSDIDAYTIAISGDSLTLSSPLSISVSTNQQIFGTAAIGTKYMLFAERSSSTNVKLWLLNVSSTTPVSVSTQNLSQADDSGSSLATAIVKVAPWTYAVIHPLTAGYIVKLTPSSSLHAGLATAAITDAATGTMYYRYNPVTLTGITLTSGSKYYIDDTGQPTVNSSLTASTLGVALSTTKILLQ